MRYQRRAFTLVEAIIFMAVAILVILGIVGLLSRGGRIVTLGSKTSGTQVAMRTFLEQLDEDAGELLYFADNTKDYDSSNANTTFAFIVKSTRPEKGIATAETEKPARRKIEYKVDGQGSLKDLIRTVTMMDSNPPVSGSRTLVQAGVSRLQIRPIIAVKQGPKYLLASIDDSLADQPGSTPMGLGVRVAIGEKLADAKPDQGIEDSPVSVAVTKVWCRDRIIELSRGALP